MTVGGRLLAGFSKWLAGVGMWLAGFGRRLAGVLLVVLGKLLALGNWLKFLAVLGALVVGGWLLYVVWHGQQIAAAFTRVGGETHVETAVEASRFWVTPPRRVVTVGVGANQATMLGAAQCAMAYNAPLLFRSQDLKRERMVEAVIASWGLDPNGPDVISVDGAKRCLPHKNPADVKGLSAFGLPGLPLPRPRVAPARDGLAPVVVFAGPWASRYPPDIAVGLALAAHMAKTYGEVSLVVVPRYEEASSTLNDELRNQHALVKGGVILGDPNNLSEDTRALLRQLLTSANEQTVLGQIQSNLLLIGPLLAALAALFAVGRKPEIGKNIESRGEKSVLSGREQQEKGRRDMNAGLNIIKPPAPSSEPLSDWLQVLDKHEDVTVWLRTGPKLDGKVDYGHQSATVLRLKNVNITDPKPEQPAAPPQSPPQPDVQPAAPPQSPPQPDVPPAAPPQSPPQPDVLVPFEDIQLIIVKVPTATAPNAK